MASLATTVAAQIRSFTIFLPVTLTAAIFDVNSELVRLLRFSELEIWVEGAFQFQNRT